MIVGLGIDLVELPRIKRAYSRFGLTFAKKILHDEELKALPESDSCAIPYLASRFAAKEAVVKALGTGFRDGIWFQDFAVGKNPLGQPILSFYGAGKKEFERLGATSAHLSLTHGRETAAAVVVLEK